MSIAHTILVVLVFYVAILFMVTAANHARLERLEAEGDVSCHGSILPWRYGDITCEEVTR